jgi:hypothetical protein
MESAASTVTPIGGAINTLLIEPRQMTIWLRLKLLAPVKHDDPGVQDDSNASLFRRQLQRVQRPAAGRLATQDEVDALCRLFPVPVDIFPFFESFAALYGGGEGSGLMEGMRRWTRLEDRCRQAAVRANTLLEFWSILCAEMRVVVGGGQHDRSLLTALTVPPALGGLVLQEFVSNTRLIVMLGREWNQTDKGRNPNYAEKAGVSLGTAEDQVLYFEAPSEAATSEISIRVPEFSGNSFRHQGIREPGAWHLLARLGIAFQSLPPGVQALLENGGNIAGGSSAPSNAFGLTQMIRQTFPLVGLVGGSTDSFILGESNLASVNAWIVCRENNDALALAGVESDNSIFEMLDMWTQTRHANRSEQSPMPYGFETLQKGTEVMVRLGLSPYIQPLEVGCLLAALETWRGADATIGGAAARGFGRVGCEYHQVIEGWAENLAAYESYLVENRESLTAALMIGTLGTDKVVCR